jgi:hypothetical protein
MKKNRNEKARRSDIVHKNGFIENYNEYELSLKIDFIMLYVNFQIACDACIHAEYIGIRLETTLKIS